MSPNEVSEEPKRPPGSIPSRMSQERKRYYKKARYIISRQKINVDILGTLEEYNKKTFQKKCSIWISYIGGLVDDINPASLIEFSCVRVERGSDGDVVESVPIDVQDSQGGPKVGAKLSPSQIAQLEQPLASKENNLEKNVIYW